MNLSLLDLSTYELILFAPPRYTDCASWFSTLRDIRSL